MGANGQIGPVGPRGPKGNKGPDGSPGTIQGQTGLPGAEGDCGLRGPKGEQGDSGESVVDYNYYGEAFLTEDLEDEIDQRLANLFTDGSQDDSLIPVLESIARRILPQYCEYDCPGPDPTIPSTHPQVSKTTQTTTTQARLAATPY